MHRYALERLYTDQEHDLVIDAIPPVIAWLPEVYRRKPVPPYAFNVQGDLGSQLIVDWDLHALSRFDSQVVAKVSRYRTGRTAHREQLTELAGYGLAMVAISALLKEKVVKFSRGIAPDLLLSARPGKVRGVEVAARSEGGLRVLQAEAENKRAGIESRSDLQQLYFSLWSKSAPVHLWMKIVERDS